MLRSSLTRYKLGLAVIGLFTVGLLVMVLMQASATKHDTETFHSASTVADNLSGYVSLQNKIPATLTEAHITKVPAAVSYQKLSDTSYKFCVTYKADSSNFDATSVATSVASGYYGTSFSDPTADTSYLYISSSHHKGANCQTIKPNISTDYSSCPYYDSSYSCPSLSPLPSTFTQ